MKIGPRGKKKSGSMERGGWRAGVTYLSLGLRETFLAEEVSRVGITVCPSMQFRASLVAQMVKNPPAMQETQVQSLSWEDPLEKKREVAQSCPTLCDAMDCSPPGSSVHGIFQA